MNFFISDTHFLDGKLIKNAHVGNFAGHRANFFRFQEVDATIIDSWNRTVKASDTVYHLGDLAVYKRNQLDELIGILEFLNFKKLIFVRGNHDHTELIKTIKKHKFTNKTIEIYDVGTRLKIEDYNLVLTHYPLLLGKTENMINLHGHLHFAAGPLKNNINIGVDSSELEYLDGIEYGQPLNESQIKQIISRKQQLREQ